MSYFFVKQINFLDDCQAFIKNALSLKNNDVYLNYKEATGTLEVHFETPLDAPTQTILTNSINNYINPNPRPPVLYKTIPLSCDTPYVNSKDYSLVGVFFNCEQYPLTSMQICIQSKGFDGSASYDLKLYNRTQKADVVQAVGLDPRNEIVTLSSLINVATMNVIEMQVRVSESKLQISLQGLALLYYI